MMTSELTQGLVSQAIGAWIGEDGTLTASGEPAASPGEGTYGGGLKK